MMKKLLLLLTLPVSSIFACELGEFTAKKSNQYEDSDETKLALIDNSQFSKNWLAQNADYLITNQVPVLVKNISNNDLLQLNKKYKGLLAGKVPEPVKMLNTLCQQIGIEKYPAVVDKGVIWQVNPERK